MVAGIYLVDDVRAKIEPLRDVIEDGQHLDRFAGLDLTSDFDAHFSEGVAMAHLDATEAARLVELGGVRLREEPFVGRAVLPADCGALRSDIVSERCRAVQLGHHQLLTPIAGADRTAGAPASHTLR